MKQITVLVILLLFISLFVAPVEAAEGEEEHLRGKVKIIKDFYMPQLNRKRTIRIYLPPDYEKSNKHYPVLYMNDGQQIFNEEANYGGWKVDESLDRLWQQEKTEGIIVVGIDNGGKYRGFEYGYVSSGWFWENPVPTNFNPQGKKYQKFLTHTLKPYIDKNYRTKPGREHTGIAGSSLGAKISLCIALDCPEVFSRAAGISGGFIPLALKDKINFEKKEDMKIYLDIGTREKGDTKFSKRLIEKEKENYRLLKKLGFKNEELKLVIDKGATHNEKAWAKRFSAIVLWLFEDEEVNFEKYFSGVKVY